MLKKFIRRGKGCNNIYGIFTSCYSSIRSMLYNINKYIKSATTATFRCCRKPNFYLKRILKSECGALTSIELLIWTTITVFIIFGGIDYYVVEKQLNDIEEVKTHYLSQMKISGVYSRRLQNNMEEELQKKGLSDIDIYATDGYDSIINSDDTIFRNVDDVKASTINLYIKAKPKVKPFVFGKLLGVNENEEFYFNVKGRTVSERPNY